MGIFQPIIYFLLAVLGTLLSVFSKDIPPPNDSDLHLKRVAIPRQHNAYYSLIPVQKYLYTSTDDSKLLEHLARKKWNQRFVENMLRHNRQALRYFDQAAHKPQFQDPTIDAYELPSVDVLMSFRNIARVSSLKAASLFRKGSETEAFREALKIIETGQKIQNSQGTMVHYFFGTDIKRIGLERIRQMVTATRLSPQILISYARQLEEYKNNEEGLRAAFKWEYEAFAAMYKKDVLDVIKSKSGAQIEHLKKHSFYFKPHKTKSLFLNFYRRQMGEVGVPCGLRKFTEIQRFTDRNSSTTKFLLKGLVTENFVGKVLFDIGIARLLVTIHETRCEDDLLISATQASLALRAHKMETGKDPLWLGELVPRYLPRVPEDPFDGKSLRYSTGKKLVYSVGMDLVDSGGREPKKGSQAGDRVFRIHF